MGINRSATRESSAPGIKVPQAVMVVFVLSCCASLPRAQQIDSMPVSAFTSVTALLSKPNATLTPTRSRFLQAIDHTEENVAVLLARRLWPRFSGDDCVKQRRANQAQCIPCKKNLSDGTEVNRFVGNCKRDATVLASQIFTPWHFCRADGGCPQGRLPKFRGRKCWAFNKGEFTRFNGPAGVCIKESWRTRHIPTVRYALANMAHGNNGRRNVADFIAAYQWSMEQREAYGEVPETVMTCELFCNGQNACGNVGDCTCGEECDSEAQR